MADLRYISLLLYLSVVHRDQVTCKPSTVTMVTELRRTAGRKQQPRSSMSGVVCGDVCLCKEIEEGILAYCTGKNLTTIPEGLPNDIIGLNMDNNLLTSLDRRMFHNLRRLLTFTGTVNNISVIESGTFSELPNLITIDLTKNPLLPESMVNLFCSLQSQMIQEITLNAVFENDQITLSNDLLACLLDHRIDRLYLGDNNFGRFSDGVFGGLYLDTLSLVNTTTAAMFNTNTLLGIRLRTLDLGGNYLRSVPRFCLNGTAIVPNLASLYLDNNAFNTLTVKDMECLPDLEFLSLKYIHTYFSSNFGESRIFACLPSLRSLQYQGNAFVLVPEQKTMFQLSSFTYLDVSGLQFYVYLGRDPDFNIFLPIENLTDLTAGAMDFNFIPSDQKDAFFAHAFQNLVKLVSLDITRNSLSYLSPHMFKGSKVLKQIELQHNLLTQLPDILGLVSLQHMDFSQNEIAVIRRSAFPVDMRKASLVVIKLDGNPFSCTCELQGFVNFMRRHYSIFRNVSSCRCATPQTQKGIPLLDCTISGCSASLPVQFFMVVVASGICLSVALIASFVYRYRWHVKYLYFQMKSKQLSNGDQRDSTTFLYDAFISYHAKSLPWVKSALLPLLENQLGLKICLHDRDWLAGIDIVENIVASVNGSRKVILVVTNAFARSQWCQLELTMAQHHLLEKDKNNLILILMEDIHDHNMTPRLALQMKSRTYIEWDAHPKAQELFARKLEKALKRADIPLRLHAV